mgnify:CR=1 FL=1
MEKLEYLELLKMLVEDEEWRKEHPTFNVDPEIVKLASVYTKFWLKRWKEGTQKSWTEKRERNNYIGLIGQCCFEFTLQQIEIPYVYNHPAIDWRGKKKYDFRIPYVETIEIKTVDYQPNQQRLLIKCSEWHNSDFVLALKLSDKHPTKVKFIGYATKQEVNKFTYAENEFPCYESPCLWQFLTTLHPASEFFNILKKKTERIWST